jgi:hypothetical protein
MIIKKLIKNIFRKAGFEIKRINKEIPNANFEDLIKKKIIKNPIIFDVGGNSGQSIEKFKRIFGNPIIHSFEPIKSEFDFASFFTNPNPRDIVIPRESGDIVKEHSPKILLRLNPDLEIGRK